MGGFLGGGAIVLLGSWDSTKRDFGAILAIIALGCGVSAFVVLYFAMRHLWQTTKSRILQKSIHAFMATLPISVLLGAILGVLINEVFLIVILFGGLIYGFILSYRIHKEVAYITNQPLFMWAFWLGMTIILSPIAVIIYIIAWIKVCEIRESMSAGEYENKAVESNTDSVKWF